MGILSAFKNELNKDVYIYDIESSYINNDVVFERVKRNKTVRGALWSKAIAEKYFGDGLFVYDVEMVLCCRPFELTVDSEIEIDGKLYNILSTDNVADLDEILLVGLKVIV